MSTTQNPPVQDTESDGSETPRLVLILVALASGVIFLAGLRSISGIVGPVFLALVLTITVHPIRTRLTKKGLPEWVGSIASLISVYMILILLALALVVSIGRLAALLPTYVPKMDEMWANLADWLGAQGIEDKQIQAVVDAFDPGSLVGVATDILGGILGLLTNLFFIITVLLFIVFDTGQTGRVLDHLKRERPHLVAAILNFARGTRSYMAVSAGFGLVVAVVDTAVLTLIGVPGAFIWGVLAFVTNFIPNIGFVIGVIPPALIGLLEGGPSMMFAVIAAYSVINFVIQSVIQPRIVGDRVGLSATVTFLSLVFWAAQLGALGALLAVPLTLLFKAILVEADPRARWVIPIISGKTDTPPTIDAVEAEIEHELEVQPEPEPATEEQQSDA